MVTDEKTKTVCDSLNCRNCGAVLRYEPGTHQLKCDYCGTLNDIAGASAGETESVDYNDFVDSIESVGATPGMQSVKCNKCGSQTVMPQNVTAEKCPFCASPLVIELTEAQGYVRPHYILPFVVNQEMAKQDFLLWLKHLSFAPSNLISQVSSSSAPIDGVYLPYWAYDADAETNYNGMRGDYYYTTETYTEDVDGEQVVRTQEVRHTNWFAVSGLVENEFKNIVINASKSLTQETLDKLGRWDFNRLVPYDERYVSGFRSETYRVTPSEGLSEARASMKPVIENTIFRDIGGDEQQISGYSTRLSDVKIKYILLPIWISSYVYKNKTYQFAINGYTGKVSGKRPWSPGKIIGLIVLILAALLLLFMLFKGN